MLNLGKECKTEMDYCELLGDRIEGYTGTLEKMYELTTSDMEKILQTIRYYELKKS